MLKKEGAFALIAIIIIVILVIGAVILIFNYKSKEPSSQESNDQKKFNISRNESLQQQFFGIPLEEDKEQTAYIQTTEEKPPVPPE